MNITFLALERRKRNLRQRQLAEDLNISQCHLSNIETLRFSPSQKLQLKMEDYFEKPIEHLLSVLDL